MGENVKITKNRETTSNTTAHVSFFSYTDKNKENGLVLNNRERVMVDFSKLDYFTYGMTYITSNYC